jgi:hypothetical protein
MEHQILQPTHNYKEYANSKLQWLPSDTKELFIKNKKEKLQELRSSGWLNTEIEYSFNSYGFRSEEFSTSPSILYLGCSFTVGIGLRVEHSWPYLVSTAMNLKCFNLGLGASSNDTAFRMAEYWIKELKPKVVILLSPFSLRYETLERQEDGTILSIDHTINNGLIKNQMICEENGRLNQIKNQLAIKTITKNNDARFVSYDTENFPITDRARDLQHPGIQSNKSFANLVLNQLQ